MKKVILIIGIVFSGILMHAQTLKMHDITFSYSFSSWKGKYLEKLNDVLLLKLTTAPLSGSLCYLVINKALTRGEFIVYLKFEDGSVFEFDFWSEFYGEDTTEILLYNDVMDKFVRSNPVKVRIHERSSGKNEDFDISEHDYTLFIEKYLWMEEDFTQEKVESVYRNRSLKDF